MWSNKYWEDVNTPKDEPILEHPMVLQSLHGRHQTWSLLLGPKQKFLESCTLNNWQQGSWGNFIGHHNKKWHKACQQLTMIDKLGGVFYLL